ncbi:uncharacterized protein F4812DRAFT_414004 [Daldinia caldariorum]|uniref:uncharacterized protein n=1 Tax=Daldinia caldariorum TaxID=326644 RepID=UPI0020073C91|nr:uncharacterized protein F4812DRAFT_414004 [Daldinia caldariorum]KAI1471421.1 hypothetical protein F4812DRAFT_414004 [Daldinia caldariorum]
MCPHDLGPAFNGPGKWNRGAYNCYDPKDYPTAATGTPTQSYQTNGNAGESSAMAAQSFLGRERQQWDRIQAYWNHEYIKSPFAPSTLEEYLTFKGETVKAKQLALLKKIDDDFNQHTDPNNQPVRVQMSPRLLQIHQNDGLTLVNARISIWHQNPTLFIPIDWPVLWEYEYYQGKQLPLPRVQLVDEAFEHLVTRWRNFPDHGPGVPRQFRKIAQRALRPAYDNMTAPEFEDMTQERDREVAELNMDDLNGFTRELLQNIDG